MKVYNQYEDTVTYCPEPIGLSQQMMPTWSYRSQLAIELASKMPQLGLSDILFIAAIVHLPNRPYGTITHLASCYRISRVSVYELGERVVSRLEIPTEPIAQLPSPEAVEKETVSKYLSKSLQVK